MINFISQIQNIIYLNIFIFKLDFKTLYNIKREKGAYNNIFSPRYK